MSTVEYFSERYIYERFVKPQQEAEAARNSAEAKLRGEVDRMMQLVDAIRSKVKGLPEEEAQRLSKPTVTLKAPDGLEKVDIFCFPNSQLLVHYHCGELHRVTGKRIVRMWERRLNPVTALNELVDQTKFWLRERADRRFSRRQFELMVDSKRA